MNKLLERVQGDYPNLVFREGRRFSFRYPRTVRVEGSLMADGALSDDEGVMNGGEVVWRMRLLHEVGHAILGHRGYGTDVERLKMEREAWEKARELAERYGVEFDDEVAEGELDSYREWLHGRSVCKVCGLTRYQDKDGRYHCPECEAFGGE